jgi:hypothetical protein
MTIIRRRSFLTLLLGSFASAGEGINALAAAGTIALFAELGDLLAKTADAISKFGDSIAHLVTLGAQGYDAAAARRAHADLIELRVKLEELVFGANMPLIRSINEYVQRVAATPMPAVQVIGAYWFAVVGKVENAAKQVEALLKDVSEIRNDFVLQDSYSAIELALHGRRSLLADLRGLAAPVEQDELQALSKAGQEYQKLSDATEKASRQLATYIGSLK